MDLQKKVKFTKADRSKNWIQPTNCSMYLKKHVEEECINKKIPGRNWNTTRREDSILVKKKKAPQTKSEMKLKYGIEMSVYMFKEGYLLTHNERN